MRSIGRAVTTASLSLAVLAALSACSSFESSFGPENTGAMALEVAVPGASSGSSSTASATPSVRPRVTVSRQGDEITIDAADIVVRELQVAPEGTECEFRSAGGGTDTDTCSEFNTATTDLTLPTASGDSTLTNVRVPAQTYDRFEVKLEVVDQREELQLLNRRPDLQNASVRVVGSFDDGSGAKPFDLLLDTEAGIDVTISQPITVDVDGQERVVLTVDVGAWFAADDGSLIDPNEATGDGSEAEALETRIEENLANSFAASPGS